MIKLFNFMFSTFPLILAWLYLFVALFSVAVNIKQLRNGEKLTALSWIFTAFNSAYIIFFTVTGLFFTELWKFVFSVGGILAMLIASVWFKYEDKRDGQRWWEW